VGDYDPVDIRLVSQLVDPLGQRQPLLIGHVLARNLKNLFATNIGDVLQVGDRLNQCIKQEPLQPCSQPLSSMLLQSLRLCRQSPV